MFKYFSKRDEVPQILETLDLDGVAKYIKSDGCKNVFIMAGAGISTSAGIPDFRSPETGLYANLARLRLPYPEAVFDISFFKRNPRPFYVLAHELAPGKFRPTLTHSFIRLLAEKGYLHTCFTQNIDTLERRAGVPGDKIIEAHGSFADQHCVECGAHYPHDKIKQKIEAQEIPICEENGCNGYVKPDIVFFGESLPDEFTNGIRTLQDADLLIVMGTSLTVYPFAKLTELVPRDCPRLLLNLDLVGSWGERVNDVACLMACDTAVRLLCEKLGWKEDLDTLWAKTAPPAGEEVETETAREKLDEVVEELAEVIGAVKLEDSEENLADPEHSNDSSKIVSQISEYPRPRELGTDKPIADVKPVDVVPLKVTSDKSVDDSESKENNDKEIGKESGTEAEAELPSREVEKSGDTSAEVISDAKSESGGKL